MPRTIDELVADLRSLETEIDEAYQKRREDIHFIVERGRVRFSEAVTAQQRLRKIGLFRYLTGASLLSVLVSPVIYAGIIPLAFMDLFAGLYQAVCFPVYHITKVRRSEYMVFDHGDLPYLNTLQKLNCLYCSYANGLAAYFREIAARTEQYFCPIKHARKILAAHDHYPKFFEYGDADSFRGGLQRLQRELDSTALATKGEAPGTERATGS